MGVGPGQSIRGKLATIARPRRDVSKVEGRNPTHSSDAALVGSPPEASEFPLQERVVLRAFLLAFQPLHVVLNPRVVAFRHKA